MTRSLNDEHSKCLDAAAMSCVPDILPSGGSSMLDRLFCEIKKAHREGRREISLTCAVQLARAWIDRIYKQLGWKRIAQIFQAVGYDHATEKNVRQAFDAEDSQLVQEVANSDEGGRFLKAVQALIEGAQVPWESAAGSEATVSVLATAPARAPGPRESSEAALAADLAVSKAPADAEPILFDLASPPSTPARAPAFHNEENARPSEPIPVTYGRLK
ncbi:hypothetical protein GJ654_12415 [Rhodoblastus acidophilus]|uniref:Uncharacterized protein n=1 Tax=Rhodoblastus acidophilus TaxID=1074 RepID=A0A6N8DMN6_RHOAC|nr:hypothetical protein [Rhodoblastus acidophilus]MCW2275318.1 hypothetical protein [Rhodoblastus acidophilus]MTV31790.1 hypothetical protein [Rhodoblastus acidophilus]